MMPIYLALPTKLQTLFFILFDEPDKSGRFMTTRNLVDQMKLLHKLLSYSYCDFIVIKKLYFQNDNYI